MIGSILRYIIIEPIMCVFGSYFSRCTELLNLWGLLSYPAIAWGGGIVFLIGLMRCLSIEEVRVTFGGYVAMDMNRQWKLIFFKNSIGFFVFDDDRNSILLAFLSHIFLDAPSSGTCGHCRIIKVSGALLELFFW